jgi:hypothetical protein
MAKATVWLSVVLVVVLALLILTPAVAAAAAPSAPSAGGCCWYRVRWGDNLTRIAWQHCTTVWYLQKINNICNPNRIYAGTWIKVPCCQRSCW